jgi:hypothetical protein
MQPTLLIMAAGAGSRFGGLKQMEPLGPDGATLLDYSVHDAIRSGFGKIVFVIRRDIEKDFKQFVGKRWEKKIPLVYVNQELGLVPGGFKVPETRTKPWGTGQAIWAARGVIREPFAVINADDFYGRDSFRKMAAHLRRLKKMDPSDYALVGFTLKNTLSPSGTVSRGICSVTPKGRLKRVKELLKIERAGKAARYWDEDGKGHPLSGNELVSMNFWGFTPVLFEQLGKAFEKFLREQGSAEKSEFLIPRVIDELVKEKKAVVRVLSTRSVWFGMTHPADKELARAEIQELIRKKRYPSSLW